MEAVRKGFLAKPTEKRKKKRRATAHRLSVSFVSPLHSQCPVVVGVVLGFYLVFFPLAFRRALLAMADFLLFEGPMGYSLFKVAHQGDSVGNRLKEVQDGVSDLATFGKMVELSSFLPFE